MNSNWFSKLKFWSTKMNTIKETCCHLVKRKCVQENVVDENDNNCLTSDFRHWSSNPDDVRTAFYEHLKMDHGDSFNNAGGVQGFNEDTYESMWRDKNKIINKLKTRLKPFIDSDDETNAENFIDDNCENALPAQKRFGSVLSDVDQNDQISCGLSMRIKEYFSDGKIKTECTSDADIVEELYVSLLNDQDKTINKLSNYLRNYISIKELKTLLNPCECIQDKSLDKSYTITQFVGNIKRVLMSCLPFSSSENDSCRPIQDEGMNSILESRDENKFDCEQSASGTYELNSNVNADAGNLRACVISDIFDTRCPEVENQVECYHNEENALTKKIRMRNDLQFEFDKQVYNLVSKVYKINSTFKRKYSF